MIRFALIFAAVLAYAAPSQAWKCCEADGDPTPGIYLTRNKCENAGFTVFENVAFCPGSSVASVPWKCCEADGDPTPGVYLTRAQCTAYGHTVFENMTSCPGFSFSPFRCCDPDGGDADGFFTYRDDCEDAGNTVYPWTAICPGGWADLFRCCKPNEGGDAPGVFTSRESCEGAGNIVIEKGLSCPGGSLDPWRCCQVGGADAPGIFLTRDACVAAGYAVRNDTAICAASPGWDRFVEAKKCVEANLESILGAKYPKEIGGLIGDYLKLHPDNNDKFIHCASSCMLAKRCGNFAAYLAGHYKEGTDLDWSDFQGNGTNNSWGSGDAQANKKGRKLAKEVKDELECLTGCDAIYDKSMLLPDGPTVGEAEASDALSKALVFVNDLAKSNGSQTELHVGTRLTGLFARDVLLLSGVSQSSMGPNEAVLIGDAMVSIVPARRGGVQEFAVSMALPGAHREARLLFNGLDLVSIEFVGGGPRAVVAVESSRIAVEERAQ